MTMMCRRFTESAALMGVCPSPCSKHSPHEHTEVFAEARNEDIQQRANKALSWRRFWCRCFAGFLFLILTTSAVIIKIDLSRLQFPWTPKLLIPDLPAKDLRGYEQYLVEYPSNYRFIMNEPEKCKQQKPFLVLVVPVAPQNREHRDTVRSTWGGERLVLGKVVNLFFLLGLYTGEGAEQIQQQLQQESREHQDLIQSDFLDCYKNLTIKTMVMLEWLDAHCSGASYAMKIDSDMFLNVHNLVNMLLRAPKDKFMTGLVETRAAVLRDPTSKWYLPAQLFPAAQYPRYALGLGYVLSLDLPRKLVEASRHVRAVYIEDVYLGLCMRYLKIPPTDPPDRNLFHVFPVPYDRCAYSQLIATTTYGNSDRVLEWKDFKRPDPFCWPRQI